MTIVGGADGGAGRGINQTFCIVVSAAEGAGVYTDIEDTYIWRAIRAPPMDENCGADPAPVRKECLCIASRMV
jgi:hypothetical protein